MVSGFLMSCGTTKEKDPCKNPEYAKIMKDKCRAEILNNDLYGALNDILEVKRCTPKDPEVYYYLGQIYWQRKERDKAKENFQIAIKYNPKYSEAYLSIGDMFLEEGDYTSALENYKKAGSDDLFRKAYLAWNNIGWIYLMEDKLTDAEQALTRSIALDPNFCISHCNLGELRSKQKRTDEAIKEYQKAIELCPQFARAHRLLGLEYSRNLKTKEACRELNLALKYAVAESEDARTAGQYLKLLNCPNKTE